MAGTDTTANNTTILIYLLSKHPEVQARVRQEIGEYIGDDLSQLTHDQLKKLTFLEAVQKETLRMYGPSAGIFPREAIKEHFIGKIPIHKGMLVTLKIKPNHFKEEFYQQPELFNPDRWKDVDSAKADPFSFFPFSSGQRNCIGQHLALLESKIAVVTLLKRYKKITLEKPEFRLFMRTLYGA
jgi:cytochrome P450